MVALVKGRPYSRGWLYRNEPAEPDEYRWLGRHFSDGGMDGAIGVAGVVAEWWANDPDCTAGEIVVEIESGRFGPLPTNGQHFLPPDPSGETDPLYPFVVKALHTLRKYEAIWQWAEAELIKGEHIITNVLARDEFKKHETP